MRDRRYTTVYLTSMVVKPCSSIVVDMLPGDSLQDVACVSLRVAQG